MKKALIITGALFIVGVFIFVWLVSGAGPENAPKGIQVIELPETGQN